jgi:hypothetical protein
MQPNDQFGFILDENKPKGFGQAFLQDPKQRNLVAAAFVGIVLLLVFIVVSLFLSAGKTDVNALQSVAVQQNRIIKLTTTGLKSAKDPSTKSNIAVLQAFLLTDFAQSKQLLGSSVSKNLETVSYDVAIDTELDRAAQRNQYDSVLNENIDALIAEYKNRLNTSIATYESSSNILQVLETSVANILIYEEPTND